MLTFGDAQGEDEESSLPHIDHGFHSKLPPGILPHGLPTVKEVAPAVTPQEQKTKENDKKGEFDKYYQPKDPCNASTPFQLWSSLKNKNR